MAVLVRTTREMMMMMMRMHSFSSWCIGRGKRCRRLRRLTSIVAGGIVVGRTSIATSMLFFVFFVSREAMMNFATKESVEPCYWTGEERSAEEGEGRLRRDVDLQQLVESKDIKKEKDTTEERKKNRRKMKPFQKERKRGDTG